MFVYWEILLNLYKEIWQNHSSWGIVLSVSKQSKGWWNNAVKDLYMSSTKAFLWHIFNSICLSKVYSVQKKMIFDMCNLWDFSKIKRASDWVILNDCISELYVQKIMYFFTLNYTSIGKILFQNSSQFQFNFITGYLPTIKGKTIFPIQINKYRPWLLVKNETNDPFPQGYIGQRFLKKTWFSISI